MATINVHKVSYADESEMIAILLCCLLFKLGGSVTMTLGEIHQIFGEFPEVRLILQRTDATGMTLRPEHERLTVVLRSREKVEEEHLNGGING